MSITTQSALSKALAFLDRLETSSISYRLRHIRDSFLVAVVVPGERWEVEFFEDGHIEIERFISTGSVEDDEGLLEELFSDDSDV